MLARFAHLWSAKDVYCRCVLCCEFQHFQFFHDSLVVRILHADNCFPKRILIISACLLPQRFDIGRDNKVDTVKLLINIR